MLFSSAHDADAFFTASAQQLVGLRQPAVHDHRAGAPDQVWTVGPVSNTNGILSATKTYGGAYILSAGADRGQQRRHRRQTLQAQTSGDSRSTSRTRSPPKYRQRNDIPQVESRAR